MDKHILVYLYNEIQHSIDKELTTTIPNETISQTESKAKEDRHKSMYGGYIYSRNFKNRWNLPVLTEVRIMVNSYGAVLTRKGPRGTF